MKAPVTARDGEPSNRTDYLGNAYVAGIRGFPAGVDMWWFDLNPTSATFDPQLRNPSYRGQPDAFPTNSLFDVGADGGGDVDLAVGFEPPAVGNGLPNLTEVSLIAANISSSRSQDLGKTFQLDPAGSYIPADDRQWIEYYKGDYVFLFCRAPIPATPLWVATSIDGGLTFPVTSSVSTSGTTPGYIAVDQNTGWVYVAHSSSSMLLVSRALFDPANPLTPLSFSTSTVDNTTSHGHLFDSVKVGHDSVSAPRDITRGGSIPIGAVLQGDTTAGIGTASYTIGNCAGASVQPPPPPPGTQRVDSESGDGTVPASASSGKFHFDVDNSPGGQLTYTDKTFGLDLVSTTITFFQPPSGDNCVSFGGRARLNDSSNHIFTVKACDNANNGATDTFSISIDANYSASGTLKSGNINIHEK